MHQALRTASRIRYSTQYIVQLTLNFTYIISAVTLRKNTSGYLNVRGDIESLTIISDFTYDRHHSEHGVLSQLFIHTVFVGPIFFQEEFADDVATLVDDRLRGGTVSCRLQNTRQSPRRVAAVGILLRKGRGERRRRTELRWQTCG